MKYLLCNEVSHFFGPHLSTWFWPFSHIFEEFWIRSLMEIFPVFLLVVFINSYHVVFRHQHYQLLHRSSFCPAMPNTLSDWPNPGGFCQKFSMMNFGHQSKICHSCSCRWYPLHTPTDVIKTASPSAAVLWIIQHHAVLHTKISSPTFWWSF